MQYPHQHPDQYQHPYRRRPVWPVVLLGTVCGLTVLAAAGLWVYGVYSMSDPATSFPVGIRVDGSRISVEAPEGQYWTNDGPRTAAQIDAQFRCRASSATSPAPSAPTARSAEFLAAYT